MGKIDPEELRPHVEKVVKNVLELEEDKLHMERPRGIYEDIEIMIKNIVKE